MRITHAEFWAAAGRPAEIPAALRPEIAIAGRSNVGKSSLINRLTGRKKLARTSGTPGCTRGLTFYNIDDRLTLVDLPGYGWAQRSKSERAGWKALIEYYLERRDELLGVLILVDVRRGPGEEERMLADYLGSRGLSCLWVLTKADKLPRSQLARAIDALCRDHGIEQPIVTSARTGAGVDALWSQLLLALAEAPTSAGRARRNE